MQSLTAPVVARVGAEGDDVNDHTPAKVGVRALKPRNQVANVPNACLNSSATTIEIQF